MDAHVNVREIIPNVSTNVRVRSTLTLAYSYEYEIVSTLISRNLLLPTYLFVLVSESRVE